MVRTAGTRIRRILFWAHLSCGVAAGVLILVMSATGVLLTYEKQLVAWSTAAMSASDSASGMQLFMETIEGWHRRLGGEPDSMRAGLLDLANLLFVFILVSGLWLWLPPVWRWQVMKLRLLLRRNYQSSKQRDFGWHHVLGIWMLVPLLLIAVSGVVFSYPWANQLVFAAYGEVPPARREPPPAMAVGAASLQDRASPPAVAAAPTPGQQARRWLRFIHTGEVYGIAGQTVAGLASLAACFLAYTGLALAWRRLMLPLVRPG